MEPFIRNLLGRQRKRVVATILRHAETTFYDRLDEDERALFRTAVLNAVDQHHMACIDIVESSVNTGLTINEDAVRAIAAFNDNMARYRNELRGA